MVVFSSTRQAQLNRFLVTADEMRRIEQRLFDAGFPVAALMEKVAGRIATWIRDRYPIPQFRRIGVLVGPGHNGGDALVVARELQFWGYEVHVCCPFSRLKDLTNNHFQYVQNLGIPCDSTLTSCDLLIDGFFGFGLERSLTDPVLSIVNQVNQSQIPCISIDLPSGLHTDTGQPLGSAIRATHTLCLGLWKLGLLQEDALEYVGQAHLIDFDIPLADAIAILGKSPQIQRVTSDWAIASLPLNRPASTHKYKMGHLLLICGSHRYAGGALLTGLGARASGVGMLSIAVPESLKPMLSNQLPEALVGGCPETASGAIAKLPIELDGFDAIACGPGLTLDAASVVQQVLASDFPLVLDADGLNVLAQTDAIEMLKNRQAATVLTPHLGEFRRLFPDLSETCRVTLVQKAAQRSGAIVLLKGARVAIANPNSEVRLNPESTPALARGGSGDVLTGLLGGLMAQDIAADQQTPWLDIVQTGAWWHAQAGIHAAQERTQLGVDAYTLAHHLIPALSNVLKS
jgi:ADP-dependent NAD(P)H-hydrate dehydratase / NAD(P)H-hydrate epimerase